LKRKGTLVKDEEKVFLKGKRKLKSEKCKEIFKKSKTKNKSQKWEEKKG
jgi:hypothetical protein